MVDRKKMKKKGKHPDQHYACCVWCNDPTWVYKTNPDPMCAECKNSYERTCPECGDAGLAAGGVHFCYPPGAEESQERPPEMLGSSWSLL